ncbi:MAG: twin-arginine translocase TatA/TatE family subunit [Bacteroidota bacterium]
MLLNSLFTGPHMIWLLIIVLVLFGGKKIPELAKGLGKGIREFNEAKDGIKSEIESGIKDKEKLPNATTNTGTNA